MFLSHDRCQVGTAHELHKVLLKVETEHDLGNITHTHTRARARAYVHVYDV
jgi:hypothetical protein